MSTLTQFLGGFQPPTLISWYPSAGSSVSANEAALNPGALTANTWKEVLLVNGRGTFNGAVVRNGDATSRTSGIRITIDGTVVATAEVATATADGSIGAYVGRFGSGPGVNAPFRNSLRVEVRASDNNSAVRYGVLYTVA